MKPNFLLSFVCTFLVIGSIIAITKAQENLDYAQKLSSEQKKAIESLMENMKQVQGGVLNIPVDKLVVSHGLAKYIIENKIVDVKKYQNGSADMKAFVQDYKEHRTFLFDCYRQLITLAKLTPEEEAQVNESTSLWIKYAKYLKTLVDSCTSIEDDAFEIMKTLPIE